MCDLQTGFGYQNANYARQKGMNPERQHCGRKRYDLASSKFMQINVRCVELKSVSVFIIAAMNKECLMETEMTC